MTEATTASPATEPEAEDRVPEAARLLGTLFIARRDVKAVEFDGGWAPDRSKFTLRDFREHLSGARCLGTYLLDEANKVKFVAFDIDLKRKCPYYKMVLPDTPDGDPVLELHPDIGNCEAALHDYTSPAYAWSRVILLSTVQQVTDAVKAVLGLQTLNIITGGGAHVLVPFGDLVPAGDARVMASQVMGAMSHWEQKNENFWNPERIHADPPGGDKEYTHYSREIEVFPKQDIVKNDGGLGNLIRLPFGKHFKTGVRTFALADCDYDVATMKFNKQHPLDALRGIAASLGVE